jgi:hypothetical protein
MLVYYYVNVPELPRDVRHQFGSVEIVEYLVEERRLLDVGTPLVRVQNCWARLEFDSIGPGMFSKAFFAPGALVRIGDPYAIITCDPEARPRTPATCTVRIIERLRVKPA